MITVLPMEDGAQKADRLAPFAGFAGKLDVLAMREQEETFGTVVLVLEGTTLRILDITVNGQALDCLDGMGQLTADSLLRSAASYGEHFGADWIAVHTLLPEQFLSARGFREKDGLWVTPMSTIVHRRVPGAEDRKQQL